MPEEVIEYECGFKSSDDKPCENCPKLMSSLHSCGLLQDLINNEEDE